jgi:hypothetical protein
MPLRGKVTVQRGEGDAPAMGIGDPAGGAQRAPGIPDTARDQRFQYAVREDVRVGVHARPHQRVAELHPERGRLAPIGERPVGARLGVRPGPLYVIEVAVYAIGPVVRGEPQVRRGASARSPLPGKQAVQVVDPAGSVQV